MTSCIPVRDGRHTCRNGRQLGSGSSRSETMCLECSRGTLPESKFTGVPPFQHFQVSFTRRFTIKPHVTGRCAAPTSMGRSVSAKTARCSRSISMSPRVQRGECRGTSPGGVAAADKPGIRNNAAWPFSAVRKAARAAAFHGGGSGARSARGRGPPRYQVRTPHSLAARISPRTKARETPAAALR
jgi:hypothetical protein